MNIKTPVSNSSPREAAARHHWYMEPTARDVSSSGSFLTDELVHLLEDLGLADPVELKAISDAVSARFEKHPKNPRACPSDHLMRHEPEFLDAIARVSTSKNTPDIEWLKTCTFGELTRANHILRERAEAKADRAGRHGQLAGCMRAIGEIVSAPLRLVGVLGRPKKPVIQGGSTAPTSTP